MRARNINIYNKLPILDGLECLDANAYTQNFPNHTHPTFNITLIREQPFTTRLTDRTTYATAGQIVITHPDEVHATICDQHAGSSFFTFYVSPDVMLSFNKDRDVHFGQPVITDEKIFHALSRIAGDLHEDSEQQLVSILRSLIAGHAKSEEHAPAQDKLFRTFLESDHTEKFSLEATARKFGINKYKFLRLFKEQTGLTPYNFILLKRIEVAKTLLQTGDDLLGIAVRTGFYDTTHFCKHFKRLTGISPMTYRNALSRNIIPS